MYAKSDWRDYLPVFLPLLWMPVVIGGLALFLPHPVSPIGKWWPLAQGAVYLLQGLVLLGVVFSLWACWRIRGSGKIAAYIVYFLLLPVQLVALFISGMAILGK